MLPVLAVAGAIKLLRSERLDFSLVLVVISLVGGAIWAARRSGCCDPGARARPRPAGSRARRDRRAGHRRLRPQHGAGRGVRAAAALVPVRAISHSVGFDDADAAGR